MRLDVKDFLAAETAALKEKGQKLSTPPGLALVWVGNDPQTGLFIRAKQKMAQELGWNFFLHHFDTAHTKQILAVVKGLNTRSDVQGIVVQLPLPEVIDIPAVIAAIASAKDVDGLTKNSPFFPPTPKGVLTLLDQSKIDPAKEKTVLLGRGQLVGAPLAEYFQQRNWPITIIDANAKEQATEIKKHSLLIAATGVDDIVTPAMVHPDMVVIDASGVDVDVKAIEPLVRLITPKRGAIGPLTVLFLFANLVKAAEFQH